MKGKKSLLIVMQDNPDPDAVAAAGALRHIANQTAGVSCSLAHGGVVGRAENRALIRYLALNLRPVDEVEADKFDLIAMVDTQPATGNNSLGSDAAVHIVIDHHPMRKPTRRVVFTDVRREYGATSTIMYEYLRDLGLTPEPPLATALCYGIRSDTQDLGRDSTQGDIDAFVALYPLANKRMLGRIQREPEPLPYFRTLARGLNRARMYGRGLVAPLGYVDCPESVAEMADLLLRCEAADYALTYGIHHKTMYLSVRTSDPDTDAGKLMRSLVYRAGAGGGHQGAAGGQIPIGDTDASDRQRLDQTILRRFLTKLRIQDAEGKSLLSRG